MALSKIDVANFLDGTIPQGNVANASLGAVTALPAGVGGKVLQVVTATSTTEVSTTSTSFQQALTASITPSSTSNKIFIAVNLVFRVSGDGTTNSTVRTGKVGLFRGTVSGTSLSEAENGGYNISATTSAGVQFVNSKNFSHLDSPSTTSSQQYTIGIRAFGQQSSQAQAFGGKSSIVLMEVAG